MLSFGSLAVKHTVSTLVYKAICMDIWVAWWYGCIGLYVLYAEYTSAIFE